MTDSYTFPAHLDRVDLIYMTIRKVKIFPRSRAVSAVFYHNTLKATVLIATMHFYACQNGFWKANFSMTGRPGYSADKELAERIKQQMMYVFKDLFSAGA